VLFLFRPGIHWQIRKACYSGEAKKVVSSIRTNESSMTDETSTPATPETEVPMPAHEAPAATPTTPEATA
jgi:hypothetical protein